MIFPLYLFRVFPIPVECRQYSWDNRGLSGWLASAGNREYASILKREAPLQFLSSFISTIFSSEKWKYKWTNEWWEERLEQWLLLLIFSLPPIFTACFWVKNIWDTTTLQGVGFLCLLFVRRRIALAFGYISLALLLNHTYVKHKQQQENLFIIKEISALIQSITSVWCGGSSVFSLFCFFFKYLIRC